MKIRHQQVAGYFYPAEKDKLQSDISVMLQIAKQEKSFQQNFWNSYPRTRDIFTRVKQLLMLIIF